jgi:hypothetical protein
MDFYLMGVYMEVAESEFTEIIKYLEEHPLETNKYRKKVGDGKSQCFGIVNKRSEIPDLSRQCWLHAPLYRLLLDYARKHVKISFTGIQVNQNYSSKPHKDIGNLGDSYIVGFGDYTGGELNVWNVNHDIRHKPLIFNGAENLHWTQPWQGTRYSLVFHTLLPRFPLIRSLEDYDVVCVENVWKIRYTDLDGEVRYLWKKNGLPHPLRGRKKS